MNMDVDNIIKNFAQIEWERVKTLHFPYPNITKEQCMNEWNTLCNSEIKSIKSSSCLIKRFHESIYEESKENRPSSKEYWKKIQNNFIEFLRFYKNRLIHSNWSKAPNNKKYIDIGFLPDYIYLQGMTTSGKAPTPSYFKPMLAKYLIKKYLNKYDTIFDPFSGYSGRLLGAISCGKNYIGQDISRTHIEESRTLVEYLRKYNKIDVSCSLKVKNSLKTKNEYQCLLTCSPYGDIEKWGNKIKNYSCDKWINICLKNYKCKRYVFVTDDKIKKYKKYIKEKLVNKSHWGTNYEYVVVIDK